MQFKIRKIEGFGSKIHFIEEMLKRDNGKCDYFEIYILSDQEIKKSKHIDKVDTISLKIFRVYGQSKVTKYSN